MTRPLETRAGPVRFTNGLKRNRRLVLETAWAAYMAFTILCFPIFGVSVMLPSILLCELATWLYPVGIGLLTAALTLPLHMVVMTHNLADPQGWRAALEPGGLAAQLLAISFIAYTKHNRKKMLELNADLKKRIQQRSDELHEISAFMKLRAEADYAGMSEQLRHVVDKQMTALLYHSETLRNFLSYSEAPHADMAVKLVEIARQNIVQVNDLHRRLSSKHILATGIEQTIREMCAYMEHTTGTRFSISITDTHPDTPQPALISIYRIAHEAITNALRHGKAEDITLLLDISPNDFTLTVINNGKPFVNTPSDGVGMQLMNQRAEQIGATVEYTTDTLNRTIFRCTTKPENRADKKLSATGGSR